MLRRYNIFIRGEHETSEIGYEPKTFVIWRNRYLWCAIKYLSLVNVQKQVSKLIPFHDARNIAGASKGVCFSEFNDILLRFIPVQHNQAQMKWPVYS